jgi:alpha-mannosidase
MSLPEKADFLPAGITRSNTYKDCTAVFEVGLSEGADYVDVKLTFDNNVCDHRLRLAVPTYTDSDKYFAGQAFYCCQRNADIDYTTQDWFEPELHEKAMNGIIGKRASDGTGLAFVSAKGLHEGASYNDDYSSLYVTLIRGFKKTVMTNGQVGGQILGEHEFEFQLVPLGADVTYADLVRQQDVMGVGLISTYAEVDATEATNVPESYFKLSGDNILLSVIKCAEREDNAYVVRMFNASDKTSEATLTFANKVTDAVETNMNEELLSYNNAKIEDNNVKLEISPWHISTVMVKF